MTETINISGGVEPRGKFPHARIAGGLIFVSGTSSRRPDNSIEGADVDEMGTTTLDIRVQTRAVIRNLEGILAASGAGLRDIIQVTTYLVNMNDFGGYNEVWAQELGQHGPARTTVAVHQLPHPHLLIEMQVIATASATQPTGQVER